MIYPKYSKFRFFHKNQKFRLSSKKSLPSPSPPGVTVPYIVYGVLVPNNFPQWSRNATHNELQHGSHLWLFVSNFAGHQFKTGVVEIEDGNVVIRPSPVILFTHSWFEFTAYLPFFPEKVEILENFAENETIILFRHMAICVPRYVAAYYRHYLGASNFSGDLYERIKVMHVEETSNYMCVVDFLSRIERDLIKIGDWLDTVEIQGMMIPLENYFQGVITHSNRMKLDDYKGICDAHEKYFPEHKRKLKTNKMSHTMVVFNDMDPIFPDEDFEGEMVCGWIKELTYGQIADLVGSLSKYQTKPSKASEKADLRNYQRDLHEWQHRWVQVDYHEKMRRFLVKYYNGETTDNINPDLEFTRGKLFMDSHGNEFFNSYFGKDPLIEINNPHSNWFTDLLSGMPIKQKDKKDFTRPPHAKHWELPEKKIRSILKTMLYKNESQANIRKYFEDKCYVYETGHYEFVSARDLGWSVCYFHPYFTRITINFPDEFFYDLRCKLLDLRERILKFVDRYIELSVLTVTERKQALENQAKNFANIMRTPEIQGLFVQCWKKEAIIQYVYDKYIYKIEKHTDFGIFESRTKKKHQRKKDVLKDRDAKMAMIEYDIETHTKSLRLSNSFERDENPAASDIKPTKPMKWYQEMNNMIEWVMSFFVGFFFSFCMTVGGVASWMWILTVKAWVWSFWGKADWYISNTVAWRWFMGGDQGKAGLFINNVKAMILNPNIRLNDEYKLWFVNVQAFLEICRCTYLGKREEALHWGITMAIIHPETVLKAIYAVDFGALHNKPTLQYEYTIGGVKTYGTPEEFWEDSKAWYDSKRQPPVRDRVDQNSLYDVASVASLFSLLNLRGMDQKDLMFANQQFAYMHNVKKFTQNTWSITRDILGIVGKTLLGFDFFDEKEQEFYKMLIDYCSETRRIKALTPASQLVFANATKIVDTNTKFCGAVLDPKMNNIPSSIRGVITGYQRELESICNRVVLSLQTTSARDEPVCVLFTGPPGVGKTSANEKIKQIVTRIMCRIDKTWPTVYTPNMSFSPAKNDNFQSGYMNQKFFDLDDIFQSTEKKTRIDEAMMIIDYVNTILVPMNMASLDEKGHTFFTSEFVSLTTNLANDGLVGDLRSKFPIGIQDPEAFIRRVDISLHKDTKFKVGEGTKTEFRVDRCPLVPNLVGKSLDLGQIAVLMIRIKYLKAQFRNTESLMPAAVDELIGFKSEVDTIQENVPLILEQKNAELVNSLYDKFLGVLDLTEPDDATLHSNMADLAKIAKYIDDNDLDEEPVIIKQKSIGNVVQEEQEGYYPPGIFEKPEEEPDEPVKASNNVPIQEKSYITEEDLKDEKVCSPVTCYNLFQSSVDLGFYSWLKLPECLNITYIGIALIAIAATFTTYTLYKRFNAIESDSITYKFEGKGTKRYGDFGARVRKVNKVRLNSGEGNFMNSMQNRMAKGIIKITIFSSHSPIDKDNFRESDGVFVSTAAGFHIRDGYASTAQHVFANVAQYPFNIICVSNRGKSKWIEGPPDVRFMAGTDLCVFKLPEGMESLPKLYNNLVSDVKRQDITIDPATSMFVLTCDAHTDEPVIKVVRKATEEPNIAYTAGPKSSSLYNAIVLQRATAYYGPAGKGDSGAPVFIVGDQDKPWIYGSHSGEIVRSPGTTFMTPVTIEDFDTLINDSVIPNCQQFPMKVDYVVTPDKAYRFPTTNKFKHSDLYEIWGESQFAPAPTEDFINKDGVLVKPYLVASKKVNQEPFPKGEIPDEVREEMEYEYPRQGAKILTYEQALSGIPGEYNAVSVTTSPGYPYCLAHKKGKSGIIIRNPDNSFSYEPEFLEHVMKIEADLKKGIDYEWIWAEALKHELLPKEKVELGKARLFTLCPADYLILVRRYFGAYIAYIESQADKKSISVGLNPHSLAWTMIAQDFVDCPTIISGDYSNYDGSVPGFVKEFVCDQINWWYDDGEENALVRRMLYKHIIQCKRIYDVFVYTSNRGGPSGNPQTSIENSNNNLVMLRTVAVKDLKIPLRKIKCRVYGDDAIIGIKIPGYTVNDFAPHLLRRFGMTFTHWSKVAGASPHDTIHTIRYLGRAFVLDDSGIYRCPLEEQVIKEILYWYSNNFKDKTLLSCVDSFVIEAFHLGRERYKELTSFVLEKVKDRCPRLYPIIERKMVPWFDFYSSFYLNGSNLCARGNVIEHKKTLLQED